MDKNEKPKSLNEKEVAQYKKDHEVEMIQHVKINGKEAWFKNIDMQTNEAARAQKKTDDFYKTIANNTFIAGDRELIDNPKYFHHLKPQLDDLIFWMEVEVKKL